MTFLGCAVLCLYMEIILTEWLHLPYLVCSSVHIYHAYISCLNLMSFPRLPAYSWVLSLWLLSGWLAVVESCLSVRPAYARLLSIDRPSVRTGPSCKLGSARRRPRVLLIFFTSVKGRKSVCLSVCPLLDYSKSGEVILMKFWKGLGVVDPHIAFLNPDYHPDAEMFRFNVRRHSLQV